MGTSIAPYNFEKQKECIVSWIRHGIQVVACNTADEIAELKEAFKDIDVEFRVVERDSFEVSGKHLPYIQDILNIVSSMTDEICGYFNSDIYLGNFDSNLFGFICEESRGSILITHRNEVDTYEDIYDLNWEMNLDGIDAFFLDKNMTDGLFGDEAYVQTTWDGLLISHCYNRHLNVKTLQNPVMFHIRHKVRWNYSRTEESYRVLEHRYYSGTSNPRREIFLDRYETYFDRNEEVVYFGKEKRTVLFVLFDYSVSTMESLKKLNCDNVNYKVSNNDASASSFDIVVYVSPKTILRVSFVKYILFLGEAYKIKELIVGGLYASCIYGRHIYNQLNKSIQQLNHLDFDDGGWDVRIVYNKHFQNTESITRKMIIPICYHEVEIKAEYVDRIQISQDQKIFIMPAGYRGGEWYAVNHDRFSGQIVGFLDNDQAKEGMEIADKKTILFGRMINNDDDITVIICTKYYLDEIHRQLCPYKNINCIDGDLVLYIEDGVFYVFNPVKYATYKTQYQLF